jgi:hypothetical protein
LRDLIAGRPTADRHERAAQHRKRKVAQLDAVDLQVQRDAGCAADRIRAKAALNRCEKLVATRLHMPVEERFEWSCMGKTVGLGPEGVATRGEAERQDCGGQLLMPRDEGGKRRQPKSDENGGMNGNREKNARPYADRQSDRRQRRGIQHTVRTGKGGAALFTSYFLLSTSYFLLSTSCISAW